MQKKFIFFTTVIVLFLTVLFLDQNSAPVPVKIILGDPRPVGLSSIIIVSILIGVLLSAGAMYVYKMVSKAKKGQESIE